MCPNHLTREQAAVWVEPLNNTMRKYEINARLRAAYFLATILEETGELTVMEEIGDDEYFTRMYEGREDLGNTEPGDGIKYRGRGPMQLTGRANYRKTGERLGQPLEDEPDLVLQPQIGLDTAGDYWFYRANPDGRYLNQISDDGEFYLITLLVNGGYTNMDTRLFYLDLALKALPEEWGSGVAREGGDLMFSTYNFVAAPDAPFDRAIARAAYAALDEAELDVALFKQPGNIKVCSRSAYYGAVGKYGCIVIGHAAHGLLDPVDQPYDVWEKDIDTWRCWDPNDDSRAGTMKTLRNRVIPWIASRENRPNLLARFDAFFSQNQQEYVNILNQVKQGA